MKAQKWIYAKAFDGVPNEENLVLEEFELSDDLQENEILFEAVYFSVDPYMRAHSELLKTVPMTMHGTQVSKAIKSNNPKVPVGTMVLSRAGWISHYVSKGDDVQPILFNLEETPASYCLGILGMPGATAYFGLYELMQPKAGEILIVNGAAGAVGSVVGQLAKIRGCTVIGFVGSDDKLDWCKNELGFDHVFNYKKINFSEAISQVAPNGVDLFFDNVGGEYYSTIINKHMRQFGRVSICGSIDNYNDKEPKLYPGTNFSILGNELKVQGFVITSYMDKWPKAFMEMNEYIKDGRLKTKETVYKGIDKMRDAFYGLFKGENIGKAIIQA